MGTEPIVESQTGSYRYEAIVRISETIAACREPEEMATTLASEIGKFLHFDHLYFVVLKENSTEIEYLLWGKSPIPMPDLPMQELPTWAAINSRDPQHTPDWDAEERFPRFREYAKKIRLGSSIRVPLITPHRPLGVFGIIRDTVNPFSEEANVERRGFDRLMVGSVTERVLRKASCPVLAVHKPSQDFLSSGEQQDPVHLNRILFCTDFSENSERALGHAISLTAEYNAELTLLHVLEDIPSWSSIDEATSAATEQLDELVPPEKPKAGSIKTVVRRGSPYQQIIQLVLGSAKRPIDYGSAGPWRPEPCGVWFNDL